VQLEGEATPVGRWQSRHREAMAGRAYLSLGGIDRRAEGTNGKTRGYTGRKDGGHYCSTREGGHRRVTCRRVLVVAAAAPDDRNRVALRRELLTSNRVKARQDRLTSSVGFSEGDYV
jgi:hypothetical protein